MPNPLLIASTNPGKLVEIQAIIPSLHLSQNLRLILPLDLGIHLEVIEDGQTYAENASRKALAFSRASSLLTLADDSGLEVDALQGQPGIHSARYSVKPGANDADRRSFLLQNLHSKPRPWLAHFRCVIALATPAGEVFFSEGICPGEIVPQERGSSGFGYDPIFLVPEYNQTMAELGLEVKNKISHRARALMAARPILENLLPIFT
jgi:XTP/dITP diphosphohydrolase